MTEITSAHSSSVTSGGLACNVNMCQEGGETEITWQLTLMTIMEVMVVESRKENESKR